MRFHTQTAGSTLTAQQPQNNVVRVAIQALAAVCGGTQSLHTNSLDEALGLPTEEAARLALRTQQVVALESGVADVADPLGGSYVIEAWTEEIVRRARDYIRRMEEMGGALAALERGFQQREIADAAYQYQLAVEEGRQKVVGMNAFAATDAETEAATEVLRIDPAMERDQVERLRALRDRRDAARAGSALQELTAAAGEDRNLMPAILDCVRASVTLGEIADAAYHYQLAVEEGRQKVVGMNAFAATDAETEAATEVLRIDPAVERDQVERLQALRGRRDAARAGSALQDLTAAAGEDRNLT
jgi:methylmalonyl-CoA mutase N-terminal domain/subunit